MNVFDAVKNNVSCLDAGKHYGLNVNRSGQCNCIFHNERSASLKLYPGTSQDRHSGFYCFGCHKSGSVIDLVSGIFEITAQESAVMLAKDYGIPYDGESHINDTEIRRKQFQRQAERDLEDRIRRFSLVTFDYLRALEAILEYCNPDDDVYYDAVRDIEIVRYYADLWTEGTYTEKAELAIRGAETFGDYERRIQELTTRIKENARRATSEGNQSGSVPPEERQGSDHRGI